MMEQRRGRRLVLFPMPLQGHMNPMLDLANILHSKGFSITIIHTKLNSPNPSNHPHFTFLSISDGLSSSEREALTNDVVSLISLLNANCVEPLEQCLARLMVSNVSSEPVSCLISDAIFHFTRDVAERLNLPRVVLRTGNASSFVVFAAFPLLREKGYVPIQDSQLEEPIVELPPLKVKDLPVISTPKMEAFYELVDNFVSATKASSGIIWNTFEELEQSTLVSISQQFSVPVFPIGPFHKHNPISTSPSASFLEEDQSSISWLNSQPQKSVVYVSFGSIAAISETLFLEIAWGLANSGQPFLWVVRPGSVHGSGWIELLPGGFLENLDERGHIVKWAPQREVLSHQAIGAFWTHNGWNSTLESICEGVPMICTPSFSDQKVNARYVSRVWKVGLQLEDGIERGEVEKIIRKLMKEKEGDEITDRVSKLKAKANSCLKQGGSSHESLERLVSHICSLDSFAFPTMHQ